MALKKIEIFPAVVGKNLNLLNFVTPGGYEQILMTEKTNQRKYHYEITRGAVGCYLSHLSIYKKIIESNLNYGIIFEDDSIIANDFYQKLLYGLNVVPPDWDIFLLGMICLKCDISKDYVKVNRFWGTHGYIIKKESAVKILSYLDKPISKQIDADLSLLIKKNLINVYAINPMIVIQDPKFKSDIQMKVIDSPEAFNEEFAQQQLMKFYAKNRIKN
jgi:glycosyl transferase family 25